MRAWQAAYRGLLPDDVLDEMTPARQAEYWRAYLEELPETDRLWVVDDGRAIVGYARVGQDDEDGRDGQIFGLFVDPASGTPTASALLDHVLDDLRRREVRAATVWLFNADDASRSFYADAGFTADAAERESTQAGVSEPELRYRLPLGVA